MFTNPRDHVWVLNSQCCTCRNLLCDVFQTVIEAGLVVCEATNGTEILLENISLIPSNKKFQTRFTVIPYTNCQYHLGSLGTVHYVDLSPSNIRRLRITSRFINSTL